MESRRPTVRAFTKDDDDDDDDVEAQGNGTLMTGPWPSSGYKGLITDL